MGKMQRIALQAAGASSILNAVAFGQPFTKSWIGPNGDWASSFRWSPNGVPTASDDVLFGVPSLGAGISTASTFTIRSLTIDATGANAQLTAGTLSVTERISIQRGYLYVSANGRLVAPHLTVAPGASALVLGRGTIMIDELSGTLDADSGVTIASSLSLNDGTLRIGSTSFARNGVSISGAGTVLFNGQTSSRIDLVGDTASFTIGSLTTVRSTHSNGFGLTNVLNNGTVQASNTTGAARFVFSGINQGTILAVGSLGGSGPYVDLGAIQNRGFVKQTFGNLLLSEGWQNVDSGTFDLQNCDVFLAGSTPTAQLLSFPLVGGSAYATTVDNRQATLNIDSVPFPWSAETIRGGVLKMDGTGSLVLNANPKFSKFQGVNLDLNLSVLGVGPDLQITDSIVVNSTRLLRVDNATIIPTNDVTIGGGGVVLLRGSSSPAEDGIRLPTGKTVTIGPSLRVISDSFGSTIGQVNSSQFQPGHLINNGTIEVRQGAHLLLNPTTLLNNGHIEAKAGSVITLENQDLAALGAFQRDGASVQVAGGTVDLQGGTWNLNQSPIGPLDLGHIRVVNGTVTAPGRVVTSRRSSNSFEGPVLSNITLSADVEVLGRNTLFLLAQTTFDAAVIRIRNLAGLNGEALAGSGTVIFQDQPNSTHSGQLGSVGPDVRLEFRSGETLIRPYLSAGIINQGSFEVHSGLLRLLDSSTAQMSSTKHVTVYAGAEIRVNDGTFTNLATGKTIAGGTFSFSRASLVNTGNMDVLAGGVMKFISAPITNPPDRYRNAGTINVAEGGLLETHTIAGAGFLRVHGLLRPQHFSGAGFNTQALIRIDGNTAFSEQSTVELDLFRGTTLVCDQITFGDEVTFDGTLRLIGISPIAGEELVVMLFESRFGTFDRIIAPSWSGIVIPEYTPDALIVRFAVPEASLGTFAFIGAGSALRRRRQ